jgi:hypothetical protein
VALPTASDVHVDAALSNISTAYKNPEDAYIADKLFPIVPVIKQSDKYYEWTKDYWFRNYVELRVPGSLFPEGGIALVSTSSYFAHIYHLGFALNDEDLENQDPAVDLSVTAAEWLADQFMINREQKIYTDFMKSGVWGTDKTLAGATLWSDFANSDPITDIRVAKQTIQKATGQKPNRMATGVETLDILAEHPLLIDKYKYTNTAILSKEQVAAALQIPELLVGEAIENTANEGATFSGGYTWAKTALVAYVTPTPGLRQPTAGYTFLWPVVGGGINVVIERMREELRKRDMLAGRNAYDQKAVGTDLGYFFTATVG